ncbi:hypothetical protein QOT17_005564 [Balamuthia mandrillaris]
MSIFASLSASKQSSLPGPSTTFRATRRVEAEPEAEAEEELPIPEAQQRPSRLRLDRAAANRFIVNAVRAAEAKGKEQIQSQERAKQKSLLPNAKQQPQQWASTNTQTSKKPLPKRTTTATTAATPPTAKRKPLKSTGEVTAANVNNAPKKRATAAKATVVKKNVAAKKKKLLLMKKQDPLDRNGEKEGDHDYGNVKGAKRKKTRGWLVRQFPEVLLAVPSLPPLCSSEEKRGRRVQYYMCIGKCKRLLLYQQLRASALKELESLFQHSSPSQASTKATRGSSSSSSPSSNIFAATLNNNNYSNNDTNIFSQHYEAEADQQNASPGSIHKTRSVVTISPTAQQGSNAPWIHATFAKERNVERIDEDDDDGHNERLAGFTDRSGFATSFRLHQQRKITLQFGDPFFVFFSPFASAERFPAGCCGFFSCRSFAGQEPTSFLCSSAATAKTVPQELESVTVAEKKDIWKHAWPFLIVATAFATYMIRGNKFEAKKPKPTTAFQIKSNELPKVTLFQLDHSPATKQVRAMMDYNGIPYEVKELNPVNRRQLSFLERDRKAVILPLAIIGEAQVETAREIMELLENVLSIQEAARLANQQLEASSSQEQNTTNENAEGQPSSKQKMRQHLFHKNLQELKTANAQKREKELGLIQRVEAQLLPLISVNRFTTWKQSRLAIRSIKEEESFTWWERFWLPFWYATSLRNQNRYSRKHIKHIYGEDLRSALAKEVGNWIEILGDKPFFGGDKPDFVDFYVYGALVSAEEEPTGEYILQHVPQVQPYLQRMTQAVNPSWKRKKQQGQ